MNPQPYRTGWIAKCVFIRKSEGNLSAEYFIVLACPPWPPLGLCSNRYERSMLLTCAKHTCELNLELKWARARPPCSSSSLLVHHVHHWACASVNTRVTYFLTTAVLEFRLSTMNIPLQNSPIPLDFAQHSHASPSRFLSRSFCAKLCSLWNIWTYL